MAAGGEDPAALLRSLRRELGAPKRTVDPPSSSSATKATGSINDGVPTRRFNTISSGSAGSDDRVRLMENGDDIEEHRPEDEPMPLFDPVWGPPSYAPGHRPRPCQVFGVLCCPCCAGDGGACNEKNKAVWRRIRWRAAVVLSVLQVIVFIVTLIVNRGFESVRINPLIGPSASTLIRCGAKETKLMKVDGQWWRLLTAIMLHGGVLHIFMNIFSQFRMGVFLEERWGSRVWLMIYWTGGIGANFFSLIISPEKAGVGASGAIYAIMGAWLAHVLCTWDEPDPELGEINKIGQLIQVVGFSLFGMVVSIAPVVDWAAHLGGFLIGLTIGWGLFYKFRGDSQNMLQEPLRMRLCRKQGKACLMLAIVTLVSMAGYIVFFLQVPKEVLERGKPGGGGG